MHRALPNGKSMDHWRKITQDLHHTRLKSMKASIDNSQPKVYAHLQTKKKREQLLLERYSQIEKENRILLEKMAEIMGRPTFAHSSPQSAIQLRSLNAEARRRKLKKITEENQQILKRIQTSGPNYDHREWDQHWNDQQVYLKNLCEYPCILLDRDKKPTPALHMDRNRSRAPSRRNQHTAPLPSSSSSFQHLPSLQADQYSSSPEMVSSAKNPGRRRRRKKKHVRAVVVNPPRLLLREGRNIDGTYVIVSVVESVQTDKNETVHTWLYKVYDPQFSDEVVISVDFATITEFARERPELLTEARRPELAAVTVAKLHVDSSSGRLRAGFDSAISGEGSGGVNLLVINHDPDTAFEDDEFGDEDGVETSLVPQPLFHRDEGNKAATPAVANPPDPVVQEPTGQRMELLPDPLQNLPQRVQESDAKPVAEIAQAVAAPEADRKNASSENIVSSPVGDAASNSVAPAANESVSIEPVVADEPIAHVAVEPVSADPVKTTVKETEQGADKADADYHDDFDDHHPMEQPAAVNQNLEQTT